MEKERLEDAISFGIHLVATRFGYRSLKPLQVSAIKAFISAGHGKDVFISLPTGYGKSFCYCSLPWLFEKSKVHIIL